MVLQRKDIEIMAPVGSYESLTAAIQAKADAVYFGIGKLNMRARSTLNFTLGDLKGLVHLCNQHNIKTYLTLNTVIFDGDMSGMKEIVDAARENGIHAIIVSDQSVLAYARSVGMEIHLSTQLSISNIESVKFYSAYADVIVLARELSLQQVFEITENIRKEQIKGPKGELIKIELFAHGALCMAISGKCYMSLHEYSFSANRGECLQVCRRGYHVTDIETGASLDIENEYIMSPKDLCTINFLDKVLKAGVQVLKIEGRARSAEYVKTVCECYDEAIQSVCDNTYSQEKINEWMKRLGTVFNRGFWDGYYLGRRLGEWSDVYGSKATKKKIYVGKVTNHFSKLSVAEILMETGALETGDEIIIIGPTTGVVEAIIKEIRVDERPVEKTSKGERCSIPIEELVRRSDKVYKLVMNEEQAVF